MSIVSNWTERENGRGDLDTDQQNAFMDLEELSTSHALVALIDRPSYQYRGTFTEIGFALGRGIDVFILCPEWSFQYDKVSQGYLLGAADNVFMHHPDVEIVHTFAQLIAKLSLRTG